MVQANRIGGRRESKNQVFRGAQQTKVIIVLVIYVR
jgi:hypothetical protein